MMRRLVRREGGFLFVRSILGYRTEAEALESSKCLWKEGRVVRVERGNRRWQVWRSVA